MASEACGQHRIISKPSALPLRELLVKKRHFSVLESCRIADWRSMPAFPSPQPGFDLRSAEWQCADSWVAAAGAGFQEVKRPKLARRVFRENFGRALATVNATNTSKDFSISGSGCDERTDTLTDDSKDPEQVLDESVSSDGEGSTPVSSKREHHAVSKGWWLRVVATSRCRTPSLQASNVISTIDFNDNGDLFATGGIARKIRICSYKSIAENSLVVDDDTDYSEDEFRNRRYANRRRNAILFGDSEFAASGEICTPGKLSSLKWRPDGSDVIGSGDYDGVVMEWSVEHGHTVCERYEHSGQRVWSLDYSKLMPRLSASASADGTVRLWSRGMEKSVSVFQPRCGNSVCSVEFNPEAQNSIAVASADANVYLYDLRKSEVPLLKLSGHKRAVSYVRFLGKDKLVSASIDSTLKLWDISESVREVEAVDDGRLVKSEVSDDGAHLVRTFGTHTNVRHFVGLSIHRGAGVLACGSETDEVYLYKDSNTAPLVHHKFPSKCVDVSEGSSVSGNSYIGAVCWREQGENQTLVAANSEGVVQVFQSIYR